MRLWTHSQQPTHLHGLLQHVHAAKNGGALRRRVLATDHTEGGGFARAVDAKQAETLSTLQTECDSIHRHLLAVVYLSELTELDHIVARVLRRHDAILLSLHILVHVHRALDGHVVT